MGRGEIMAKKKKVSGSRRVTRGAVDEITGKLAAARERSGRTPGDGQGLDIAIAPGGFYSLRRLLDPLPSPIKVRLRDHIRDHADEAMKPILRLMAKSGADEHHVSLIRDVGPNALRTIIEYLEDEGDGDDEPEEDVKPDLDVSG
jgi:hypothetical protein